MHARGFGREWNDLARVEKWLRAHGFWYWWTRNDLEYVGIYDEANDEGDDLSGKSNEDAVKEFADLPAVAPELP